MNARTLAANGCDHRAPTPGSRHHAVFGKGASRLLQGDSLLPGLHCHVLAERLTYYLEEINAIHLFREGNGRGRDGDVLSDANQTLVTPSWAALDTRKPGPQGAGWYMYRL